MEELLKNQLVASHAIAAAGSVGLATALTYPLDTVKVLVQVGSGASSKQLSSIQALSRVRNLSGSSGLYAGLGWLASGRILGVGARFGVYELLTAFYKDGREYNRVYIAEAFMAGMAAGATESFIGSPFELVKLRAQVASASRIPSSTSVTENKVGASVIAKLLRGFTPDKKALNQSVTLLSTLTTKHPDFVGALQNYPWMMTGSGRPPSVCDVQRPSNVVSLEGVGALWRGVRSGVARDSIFGSIFFGCWQFLHEVMLVWKAVGMDPEPRFGNH
uniref:Mitochondrial substrate carrier family protein n=1 Tax=Rhizophora mucronata TaxID=61149 RepID=A0A2P2JBD0_RHIMU